MEDKRKTKEQLTNEVIALRQRVAELEMSENDRKLVEEALREREEMFRLFMEHSPIYVFFKDEQIRSMELSKNYEKMLGRPLPELIGKTMCDLFPSDLAKSMVKDDLRILNEGKPIEVEEELSGRFYRTTKFPIIREGKPRRLAGFTMDITEAKLAEEALRESEARFRSYFELPLIGIAITSPEKGWIEVNDKICSMMGYSREELLRTTWSELTHPEDLVANVEQFNQVLAGQINGFSMDKRFIRKNGEVLWASIAVECVRDSGGEVKYIVGLALDITERKRVEKVLQDSEARYRELAESISDVFFAMDRDLRYTYWNKASERLTGIAAKDAIGKSLSELFPDEAGTRAGRVYLEVLRTQQPRNFVNEYRFKGKNFFFEISAYPSSAGLSVFVKDITHRKRTEDALKFTRFTVDKAASMIAWVDSDGRLIDVNDACCRSWGYSREKLLSMAVHDIDPNYSANNWPQFWQKLKQTGSLTFESFHRTKEGKVFPVEITANFIEYEAKEYHCAFARDITERRRAEEALRESEERYRILFETSPDAIALMDSNLNIITVNQPALALFGYESPEEVIGKNALEFISVNDRSRAAEDASELSKAGIGQTREYFIQTKDRRLIPAEVRASSIRDAAKQARSFIAVIRDITERRASEEMIRVYEGELRLLASELTLLEERERRQIANDLHDHIGQTLAFSKIKLGELRESVSPSLVKPLSEIHGLIEQAIQYTRSLTFELSPPILYEVGFEAAVEWLAEQIQEKHGISVDFEDDSQPKPLVKEIRVLLFKAVSELLMNVIKHAKAHKVKVAIRREGVNIRITVEDDGIGFNIPETNRSGRIRGFGLFSVRERLKHFGGSLQVQSGSGSGTLVALIAPIEQKEN